MWGFPTFYCSYGNFDCFRHFLGKKKSSLAEAVLPECNSFPGKTESTRDDDVVVVVGEQPHGSSGSENRGRRRRVKLHQGLVCNGHQQSYSGCRTLRPPLKPDELPAARRVRSHTGNRKLHWWLQGEVHKRQQLYRRSNLTSFICILFTDWWKQNPFIFISYFQFFFIMYWFMFHLFVSKFSYFIVIYFYLLSLYKPIFYGFVNQSGSFLYRR